MGVSHSFFIKSIFYDKIDLRLFSFHVMKYCSFMTTVLGLIFYCIFWGTNERYTNFHKMSLITQRRTKSGKIKNRKIYGILQPDIYLNTSRIDAFFTAFFSKVIFKLFTGSTRILQNSFISLAGQFVFFMSKLACLINTDK